MLDFLCFILNNTWNLIFFCCLVIIIYLDNRIQLLGKFLTGETLLYQSDRIFSFLLKIILFLEDWQRGINYEFNRFLWWLILFKTLDPDDSKTNWLFQSTFFIQSLVEYLFYPLLSSEDRHYLGSCRGSYMSILITSKSY